MCQNCIDQGFSEEHILEAAKLSERSIELVELMKPLMGEHVEDKSYGITLLISAINTLSLTADDEETIQLLEQAEQQLHDVIITRIETEPMEGMEQRMAYITKGLALMMKLIHDIARGQSFEQKPELFGVIMLTNCISLFLQKHEELIPVYKDLSSKILLQIETPKGNG